MHARISFIWGVLFVFCDRHHWVENGHSPNGLSQSWGLAPGTTVILDCLGNSCSLLLTSVLEEQCARKDIWILQVPYFPHEKHPFNVQGRKWMMVFSVSETMTVPRLLRKWKDSRVSLGKEVLRVPEHGVYSQWRVIIVCVGSLPPGFYLGYLKIPERAKLNGIVLLFFFVCYIRYCQCIWYGSVGR